MKRVFLLLMVALLVTTAAMAAGTTAAGQTTGASTSGTAGGAAALQKEPYFHGIGFAFSGDTSGGRTVVEIKIAKIVQAGSQAGQSGAQSTSTGANASGTVGYIGGLVFGDEKFPLKLIKPELTAFEADVYDPTQMASQDNKGLNVPCGHVSFKLAQADGHHSVAEGTVKIKTANDKVSGEFKLLLNELKPPAQQQPGAEGEE